MRVYNTENVVSFIRDRTVLNYIKFTASYNIEKVSATRTRLDHNQKDSTLNMTLAMTCHDLESTASMELTVPPSTTFETLFGRDHALIQIKVYLKRIEHATKWVPVLWSNKTFTSTVAISAENIISLRESDQLDLKVKIGIMMEEETTGIQALTKNILASQTSSDFVIVANNGKEFKCHKIFLSVQSSVLQTMMESMMDESVTNKMEIVDMSETDIKAFLAFLYHRDTTEATNDCTVAAALLFAAHKYDIAPLEKAMMDILILKDWKWYNIGVAMKLFLFVRKFANGANLKARMVKILKTRFSQAEDLTIVDELNKSDSEAALDFFKCCCK